MIDIHCHILPGIDDGAEDINSAIEMARLANKIGIGAIIATPHFGYGYYENNFQNISNEVEKLGNILKSNGIDIELKPGQEIFLDKHILEYYKSRIVEGLNSSRYLLVELPRDKLPEYVFEDIYELRLMGVEVIIAHPERYMYIIDKPSNINSFIEEGCLFEINISSITGLLGRKIKKTAKILMQNNICDFIASDAHSADIKRFEFNNISKYVDNGLKRKVLKNSERLIENNEVKSYSEKIMDKKLIAFDAN